MPDPPSTVQPALPQGAGYAVCIGCGALFAGAMWHIARILSRFNGEKQTSEMFMTAKRSISTGLIASAVVSSWTITATLLTSCTWTYDYGVSGAYWYGAGACVQILLFSVAAIELKRKAPRAHTFLELTKIRYGAPGHWIQMAYSTVNQLLNAANFLVGGSAVFTAVTGMNTIAGCFLLPIGVVVYTITGGLKATFLADYMHTVVIYVIILIALFCTYATSPLIGSPDKMFDLLVSASQTSPASGNPSGSYLTFHSPQSLILGIVIFTNAWAAAADVQLFQKAIAADPADTLAGYLVGGVCWFAIPFCLATTFGLVGRALSTSEVWPTFPRGMTVEEVNKGLVLPYAAQALLGKGGAVAVLLMTFMAATSAFSSNLVCIASVATYDVYRAYIRPDASGKALLRVGHFSVVAFALCAACIAAGLTRTDVGVNFMVTSLGIITAPAVFPVACTLLWRKQNTVAVVGAPLLGTLTAVACWVGAAHRWFDEVTVVTLGQPLPLVVGNATALISPMIYSPLLTFLFGAQDFSWENFEDSIKVGDDSTLSDVRSNIDKYKPDDAKMKRSTKVAAYASIAVALAFIIVFPMPLYGTRYVFSKPFFRLWIVWTFAWAVVAAAVITMVPLWQGRRTLWLVVKSILFGGRPRLFRTDSVSDEGGSEKDSKADVEIVEVKELVA